MPWLIHRTHGWTAHFYSTTQGAACRSVCGSGRLPANPDDVLMCQANDPIPPCKRCLRNAEARADWEGGK